MEKIRWQWPAHTVKVKSKHQLDLNLAHLLGLSELFSVLQGFGVAPVFHAALTIWTRLNINVPTATHSWVVIEVAYKMFFIFLLWKTIDWSRSWLYQDHAIRLILKWVMEDFIWIYQIYLAEYSISWRFSNTMNITINTLSIDLWIQMTGCTRETID